MQYLLLENVTRSYGDKVLFKNLNMSISQGEKIALIAKNGSGKSTLLRILSGKEGSDGENSKIVISKEIKTAILDQDPQFDNKSTIRESIFDTQNEFALAIKKYEEALASGDPESIEKTSARMEDLKAWDYEAKIHEVLGKLKIDNLEQVVHHLSGGQRKRLALAKILLDDADFLILDEPTNHLDIEMIEWLESYLQSSQITVFMVTHDRYFLEKVCNTIIELDNGVIHTYRGTYDQYLEKKQARMLNEASNLDKTKKLYARELEWMRRQPQARTTKAKSRIEDFYEIKEKASQNIQNDELKLQIETTRLGTKILEAHNISKSYGELKLLNGFTYKFKKGERVGIIGPNGTGKSTLLKLLTQHIPTDTGKIIVGETVVFGYYTQDGLEVDEDKTVLDIVRDIADYIPLAKGQKLSAESLLERFLFPRPQQRVKVSQLSGGERRRLYLLTILIKNPNFLILDEPTNDLDIVTLNVLEDYLQEYSGNLLIVTHDRYFMDRIVDHLFVLEGNGVLRDFNGSYTEYRLEKISAQKMAYLSNDDVSDNTATLKPSKITQEQRKEVSKLEKEIKKLEARKNEIHLLFEDNSMDTEKIMKLSEELEGINKTLEDKEMQWLELAELL